MFECFGRKWRHREERRADRFAMAATLSDWIKRDPAGTADIFPEAWQEYRQEREHWRCPCAKADGCAVAEAPR